MNKWKTFIKYWFENLGSNFFYSLLPCRILQMSTKLCLIISFLFIPGIFSDLGFHFTVNLLKLKMKQLKTLRKLTRKQS